MPLSNFDKYFLNLPPMDRKGDFNQFWERSIAETKKSPLETELVKNNKKSSHRFTSYDVSYRGFGKTTMTAELLIPRKMPKPRALVHVHDYNSVVQRPQQELEDSLAHLFITLRGHANIIVPVAATDEEHVSPGYLIENILDRDTYYVKAVYLDLYRSIDMLRLIPDLNCSAIGAIGKGFGAAAAVFIAAYTDRIAALVLDTPSFCHLATEPEPRRKRRQQGDQRVRRHGPEQEKDRKGQPHLFRRSQLYRHDPLPGAGHRRLQGHRVAARMRIQPLQPYPE